MNFINLHAHSTFSDGNNTLEEHMFAQVKLGFSAVVLTDHIYLHDYNYSLNIDKFEKQIEETRQLTDEYGIPFILGAEVSCLHCEEVAVFGIDAIKEILRIRKGVTIPLEDWTYIKRNYNCIINLCHPMHPSNFVKAGAMDFLDGYEAIHSASPTMTKDFQKPPEFDTLCALCNSDAHHILMLGWSWNETEIPITTEETLIKYIKERRSFKHHWQKPTNKEWDDSWN